MAASLVDLDYTDIYYETPGVPGGIGPRYFDYTTTDNLATVQAGTYWHPLWLELRIFDVVRVNASNGSYIGIVVKSEVSAAPNGLVTLKDLTNL